MTRRIRALAEAVHESLERDIYEARGGMPLKWHAGMSGKWGPRTWQFEGDVKGTGMRSLYGTLELTADGPRAALFMVPKDARSSRDRLSFSRDLPEGKDQRALKRLVQDWVDDLWGQYADD